jgi:NTP pyrophosphatase (non-canonical NTP hydrolase)
MDFNVYQSATDNTAIYPQAGTGSSAAVNYAILGLVGEAGEIANKWKKYFRDDLPVEELYPLIASEMGDVLWYMARLAIEMGFNFNVVAEENLQKLQFRQQRATLNGSGDNR